MKSVREITLSQQLSARMADVYEVIQSEYDLVARKIGLTCSGCPDNCCDSYFLHYTYAEWAYLWEGLRTVNHETREDITARARQYLEECRRALSGGRLPQHMCPLNDDGRCTLYTHRMMICRLHGIPAVMTRPDGRILRFPGCFRCQEIVGPTPPEDLPTMDRTGILQEMAAIESELLGGKRHLYPKVKRTIAEMIVDGPPMVDKPFCER